MMRPPGGRRRRGAFIASGSSLVVLVVVDHDPQDVECILTLVEEGEEVLYVLVDAQ